MLSSAYLWFRKLRALILLQIIGTFLGFCTTLIFSLNGPGSSGYVNLNADGNKFTLALCCLALVNLAPPLLLRLFCLPVRWILLVLMTTAVNALGFWAVGHLTGGYEIGGWLALLAAPLLMGLITGTFALLTAKVL